MRIFLLSFVILLFSRTFIVSQEFQKGFCGSTEQLNKRLLDPVFKQEFESSQELLNQAANEYKKEPLKRGVLYKIPVVFHVLHKGGIENISNEQIIDAIKILNRDFRKLNADTTGIHPSFKALAADAEIEFVLATKAPNGKCFSGITRTFATSDTTDGFEQVKLIRNGNDVFKGEWSANKYLNVFICNDLGDGKAGYTYYPMNTTSMIYGGIWILHRYIGSFGTSSVTNSRALTHEVGHWFNLSHVWGSTNEPGVSCGDDDVDDTPITKGWLYNCPVGASNCNPGVVENVENYMEYSYCSKMFTLGQKARMIAALKSSVGGRNNLWSSTNLANTGASTPQLCLVDFTSSSSVICQNETVTFNDISYNNVTSWLWTFPNGTTSTIKNPTYTFLEPGTFTIGLKVSNGTQTLSTSKVFTVEKNLTLPYYESFESNVAGSIISNWTVVNGEKNASFEVTQQTARTGVKSVTLQNFGQTVKSVDELISAPFDLTNINKDKLITLSFRYAYRKLKPATNEYLYVYLSNDCGVNWSSKLYMSGSTLSTVSESSSWKPTVASDWKTVHLRTIDAKYWQPGTRLKFMFKNDAVNSGNNIYIDDINLYPGLPSDSIINVDTTSQSLVVNFKTNQNFICKNEPITFLDLSSNNVISWQWTFPDGSISKEKNPTYLFQDTGSFPITLKVFNGFKTLSLTKYFVVQKNLSLPYYESFENMKEGNLIGDWLVVNNNKSSFEVTSISSYIGSKSIRISNFDQLTKNQYELISPPFDLSQINQNKKITLSFRYSYRKLKPLSKESLSIYLSNDCGVTWTSKLNLSDSMQSMKVLNSSWVPTETSQWNTVHLSTIDSKYWEPGTRVKFVFQNDSIYGGNNIYIDDINLYAGLPSDSIIHNVDTSSQALVVDFKTNQNFICKNEPITFIDFSSNNVISWQWTFPDGSISKEKNPIYLFQDTGSFPITLRVFNGFKTLSLTKYFTVQKNLTLPYYESFENMSNGNIIGDWQVVNTNKSSFEVTSISSYIGRKCIRIPNFDQLTKNQNELISPPFDLSQINQNKKITLSFRYSYRKLKPLSKDSLSIYFSNDCGETWSSKLNLSDSMQSMKVLNSSWYPSQFSHWNTVHLSTIDSKYWEPGTRIKFVFQNDSIYGGNNIYIDDINLYAGVPSDSIIKPEEQDTTSTTSLKYQTLNFFKLMPNPIIDILTIKSNVNSQSIVLTIYDVVGKVHLVNQFTITNNEFNLSLENLDRGTYIVMLKSGSLTEIQKIIKE